MDKAGLVHFLVSEVLATDQAVRGRPQTPQPGR